MIKNALVYTSRDTIHGMERQVEPTEAVCFAVVEALAEFEGVDSTDFPALYESIDWEGLNRLFRDRPRGTADFDGAVTFRLSDSRVVVESGDPITVTVTNDRDSTVETSYAQPLENVV